MILISTHAIFDKKGASRHGTGTEIGNYLRKKNKDFCFIRHALYGEAKSEIELFLKGKTINKKVGYKNLILPLRLLQDQLINLFYLLKYRRSTGLYIGIDPVNALSGVIVKKFGLIDKIIFYTADFAYNRFSNQVLNGLYHGVDRIAIKNADQVWNVSSRIVRERQKQGVDPDKLFLVPNTPEFSKTKRLSLHKINKHDLVIVSNLTDAIDYSLMIKAVKKLKEKYKNIRLLIIGSGEKQADLEKLVSEHGLNKNVLFLGSKSHKEVLDILAHSAVGVAVYTRNKPWTHLGDSLKVREYLACGLPVIMNDVAATTDDVRAADAGIVLNEKGDNFEKAVDELFSDKEKYAAYRENAIRLAKKYDFTKVVDQAFAKIA